MAAIKCYRCGRDLISGSMFCNHCGLAFDRPVPMVSDQFGMPSSNPIPLSQRDWFVLLMLFLCLPAGLIIMWLNPRWQKNSKIVLTSLIAAIFVGMGIYSNSPAGKKAEQDAQAPTITSNVSSLDDTPKPAPTSPKQQIKDLMKNRFGGQLVSVDVTKQYDGGYGVVVLFNIGDILTTDTAKSEIEVDMKQAYKDLYTSGIDIRQVNIAAFANAQDQYGNTNNECVYKTYIDADVGKKINWDNWPELDFSNLWGVDIMDPAFRQ